MRKDHGNHETQARGFVHVPSIVIFKKDVYLQKMQLMVSSALPLKRFQPLAYFAMKLNAL